MRVRLLFAVAAALCVVSPAFGSARHTSAAVTATLRHHVVQNRHVAWRWQDEAHLRRTATVHRENRTRSAPFLRWIVRWWHDKAYAAMRAYRQEQAAARAATRVVYHGGYTTGVTAIGSANAWCESGGDPHNTHNSKYRGKWQFDQTTWDRFAPSAWRGHDPAYVPESVQDAVAMSVTYDAWPRC